jgi:hypothetical protein
LRGQSRHRYLSRRQWRLRSISVKIVICLPSCLSLNFSAKLITKF